ncbi:MAG: alpha/beta fold hydrolase [Candidatus Acidiferrales bacterium]
MEQEIRFCTAPDGVRIAYASAGSGPPLVKAANWLNHLEFDWQSPIWRPTFEELARDFRLIRYDERGNGLSDWDAKELSLEAFVNDLESVVDAAGLDRFPLLGISQGGAVSTAYAVRHPERVSHLILYGAYARGWALREDDAMKLKREAMITLIEQGWGQDNPAFRQMWSALYIPKGNSEQMHWLSELQRISTSPANAARLVNALSSLDVDGLLARVRVPTLVLHVRDDAAVPFSEGRRLAAGIPGARFVELPGCNHLPLQGEPAWDILINEVRRFLGAGKAPRMAASDASTRTAGKGVGERLAHYRVIAALGAGGMGVVYRARDTKLEREVALKVLPDALMSNSTARARLVREAKTASALNHPNICHIYEVGEADGHSYIAMEHVGGRPLSQSIPAEGLPSETVLRYAVQLSDALAHAHERNVLHRDMKSANVMVTPEGHVKVLDFGLAKRAVAESDEGAMTVDSVTQAGAVAGTLHYLAPELLRGQPADARSDIWALGVVLFEMATGKFPFSGKTGFEASAAILRESPQQLPPQVPAGLRSIIGRCLAKEPAQRYQRASELRAAVEAISSDSAAAPVAAVPATGMPRKESTASAPTLTFEQPRRWKWLGWTGAVLSLAVAIAWYQHFYGNGANSPQPSAPAAAGSNSAPSGPLLSTGGKPSANAEANSYFEKATLFLRGQFDVPRARDLLEKALEADPKFAEARSTYALTLLLQVEGGLSNETAWLYRAEQQLQRALRDDPDCASAQAILGGLYVGQGKKELGGRQLQEVFQRDPRQLPARIGLIHYYRISGDYPAGIALARETLRLVPVFFISQSLLGNMLHESGDMPAAVREYGGVLDQDAQNLFALRDLARGHIETGDTRTAKIFLEKIRESDRRNYRVRLVWALLYAREGKRRDAVKEMDVEVQKYAEVNPNVTLEAAEFYAILGDKAKALDWLERAVRNGDERTEWFQRDPLLESIRGEDRFKNLLSSIAYRRQRQK